MVAKPLHTQLGGGTPIQGGGGDLHHNFRGVNNVVLDLKGPEGMFLQYL